MNHGREGTGHGLGWAAMAVTTLTGWQNAPALSVGPRAVGTGRGSENRSGKQSASQEPAPRYAGNLARRGKAPPTRGGHKMSLVSI